MKKYTIEGNNRLSAFGVSGTKEVLLINLSNDRKSQSPFGFWGDWNHTDGKVYRCGEDEVTIAFRLLG